MIKITITIRDKETLEEYKDVHPELICDDFCSDPTSWVDGMEGTKVDVEKKMINPQPKPRKPKRLKGDKKIALYIAAWERDGGCCVECGRCVPKGTIPHHITHKSQGGEDTIENLKTLCVYCHDGEHN